MTGTIHRRVAALESARCGGTVFTVIVTKIISPGQVPATAWMIEFAGQVYRSPPGESQDDFIERVTAIAIERHGTQPGIPSVILRPDYAERA